MKKIPLFIILFTQVLVAQIKAGEYFSNKNGEKIKLKILDDKTYELVFLYGKYEQNGSSLALSQPDENTSFNVLFQTNSSNSNKITIEISGATLAYNYSKIYFGTQTNNSSVDYKLITDLIGDISNDYGLDKKYSFEIDKTDFIYLIEDNLTEESQIQKYSLPKNVSKIEVAYTTNYLSKLKLAGEINPTSGEITISENGKSPVLFSFKKENQIENDKFIKPLEKISEKNWTYIGKKETVDFNNYPADSTATATDSNYTPKPAYVFKTKIEDNLKKALEVAKKQSDKYFVVFYDKNQETAKTKFDTFIKQYETNAGYNMYENYMPEYDVFNFYLATQKDKTFIKNISSEENLMAVFDSNGTKLYHAKWDVTEAETLFSSDAYSLKSELEPVKNKLAIDQLFLNVKTSSDAIITELEKLCNGIIPYGTTTEIAVAPPKIETIEVVKEVENTSAKTTTDVKTVEVVDATEPTYDYSLLKEKKNLYQLKASKETINNKWNKILENAGLDEKLNYKVAKIANAEVNNIGFNKVLFNQEKKILNATDFLSLDYLIKNYDAIKSYQKTDTLDYSETLGNVINESITAVLNRNLELENGATKLHYDKTLGYYKKFIEASKDNSFLFNGYLEALKSHDLPIEYLDVYNKYFDAIVPNSQNIIEQLDKVYSIENSYNDWRNYKYNFANTANDASWYVVEKVKDEKAIKNAIKWSETSLIIEKDNAYYLDTLAQLYYKNGQKQKAIETQIKAIEKINQVDSTETKEEMKNVLTKMQNGTY